MSRFAKEALVASRLEGSMSLRAIHQFHAGSAAGDGVTNGMLLTRSLLREMGLESEIFALHVAPELAKDLVPLVHHPGPMARSDEILIVHYSMGHDAHDWIDAVGCPRILAYHNITPPELLVDEGARHYARIGRWQLAAWGSRQESTDSRQFLGALADSSYNAEELRQLGFGRGGEPVRVLPLLIDADRCVARSGGAPREWPAEEGVLPPVQLLFVGRVIEHKRQHELVALLPHLRRRLSREVRLTLVGGGDPRYIDKLRAVAAQLGVEHALTITGKVTDTELAEHYRRADLFICFSEHEGFCIPLIEAAAHGVPVLAYDCGAVAETMGEGGLLLATKEPEVVAAAAALLLEAPDIRGKAIAGQATNLARFARAALRDQLARFLADVGQTLPQVNSGGLGLATSLSAYRIEGPFTSSYSLAVVNRELGLALTRLGERVELRSMEGGEGDFTPDATFLRDHPDVAALAARPAAPGTFAAPAQVVLRNMYPPRADGVRSLGLRGLACYAWEETGLPRGYAEAMNRSLDLVTVTSAHVRRILHDNGVHTPIAVIGNGTDHLERAGVAPNVSLAETMLAGKARGFRFLHVSSCFPRKGVDVLLQAWGRLGQLTHVPLSLVIKSTPNPHSRVREDVTAFLRNHPSAGPIIVIDEDIKAEALRGLYHVCDAFVAPTRAEGFGLPMAEAMLAGKPVITTAWGGQTDFCTEETAWLVGWRYAEARTHLRISDSLWAEPDMDELVDQMRRVATSAEVEKAPRLEAARVLLTSRYRWDHVAGRLRDAIATVEAAPVARLPRVCMVSTWGSRCGIAAYGKALASAVPPGRLRVLANTDAELVETDGPEVQRVWRSGLEDNLQDLGAELGRSDASTIVFQFNFGFFKLARIGPLVERLAAEGRSVHLVLHSTADVERDDLRISLRDVAPSLARATRLLVHGVDDMNRLREFGLAANAALLPHGVPAHAGRVLSLADMAESVLVERETRMPGLERKKVIATFGYLLPHKGLREMIKALAILRCDAAAEGAPVPHLLMVNALYPGSASTQELEACRQIVQDEDLSESVTMFTDYLPENDALSLLRLADIVAYTYQKTQESSSAAVRMGLASLRPVAVTPLQIFRDVAGTTHSLPGRRPEEIAAGLRRLLAASADRAELDAVTHRQARWVEEHAWPHVAARFWGMVRALDPARGVHI
jgi:glycosyltransferase involved in cell wall biosynthesis